MIDFSSYSEEVQTIMEKIVGTLVAEIGNDIPEAYDLQLQLLADSLTMYTQARDSIRKDGILITGRQGDKVKNPAISVLNSTQLFISKLIGSFGLDRMSKSKLKENTDGLSAQELLDALTK